MAKKYGLPESMKMKHSYHLMDDIVQRTKTPVVRIIPIERIITSELQPRKDMGFLDDLAESIKENGLIEPILVRPRDGQFEIIAGERRYRAAMQAGLKEIPCLEHDVPDNEALEISIIENIQRKDLNILEEAHSLKALSEVYGYTHEEIAQKVSRSRVTVTEMVRLTDLPLDVQKRCQELNIQSKTFLLELTKLENIDDMMAILDQYMEQSFSREEIKKKRKENDLKKGTIPKKMKYSFCSTDKKMSFNFTVKEKISREDMIEMLTKIIEDIKENRIKDLTF